MKGINGGEKNILKIKKEDKKITTIKEYAVNKEKREKEIIPGTFDPVFKAVLTSNKEYLAEIINYVTGLPKEDVIKKGIIINSEYVRENIKEKDKKSDLIISIENNIINLEMDRRYYAGSNRKNNKYIHKMVNHYEEKNVVQICFTSYKKEEELKGGKKVIRKYMFQDSDGNIDEYGIEKYKIDLEYIENKYYNEDEITREEKLLLMLKEEKREKLKEISKGDKIMKEVYKKLEELSEDKDLALLYDEKEREEEKRKEELEYAKELGYTSGVNKAIEQTAKNMLNKNMDISIISEITGLSKEEIQKLKENI